MAQYGKIEYWEDRYKKDTSPYDWYQKYAGLKDIITQHVTRDMKVLDLGAGNSDLCTSMFHDGYEHIKAFDLSSVCVKHMQEKWKEYPTLEYLQGDAMAMQTTFEPKSFHCIIDKGTIDSILCGYDSAPNADLCMNGIYNTLSNRGIFICVSYGTKDMRMEYIEKPEFNWKISVYQVAKKTINTSDIVIAENEDD